MCSRARKPGLESCPSMIKVRAGSGMTFKCRLMSHVPLVHIVPFLAFPLAGGLSLNVIVHILMTRSCFRSKVSSLYAGGGGTIHHHASLRCMCIDSQWNTEIRLWPLIPAPRDGCKLSCFNTFWLQTFLLSVGLIAVNTYSCKHDLSGVASRWSPGHLALWTLFIKFNCHTMTSTLTLKGSTLPIIKTAKYLPYLGFLGICRPSAAARMLLHS
jgi:hypothetical protein